MIRLDISLASPARQLQGGSKPWSVGQQRKHQNCRPWFPLDGSWLVPSLAADTAFLLTKSIRVDQHDATTPFLAQEISATRRRQAVQRQAELESIHHLGTVSGSPEVAHHEMNAFMSNYFKTNRLNRANLGL
jgi:hypothetical protein